MKNQFLSLSAYCILFTQLFAQSGPHSHEQMYLNYISHNQAINDVDFNAKTMAKMAAAGVRDVHKRRTNCHGKTYETHFVLNAAGRPLERHSTKKNISYTYLDDTLLNGIRNDANGEYISRSMYSDGHLCNWETRRNDRITYRLLIQYNQAGKVSFSMIQRGWKLRKSFTLENDYSENKLTRQRFMYNERLIQEWDYSCAPEGEELDSKRLAEICKTLEENADGSYVEHVRKMESGKVVLFKYYYSAEDQLTKAEKYHADGSLISRTEYSEDGSVFEEFSPKGKLLECIIIRKDVFGNILLKQIEKGKKKTEEKYVYNASQLLLSKEERVNGKRILLEEYSYN